ncbi:hypothetical protein DV736_g2328, partial [Chaetothyriales sp. CBS 134916]
MDSQISSRPSLPSISSLIEAVADQTESGNATSLPNDRARRTSGGSQNLSRISPDGPTNPSPRSCPPATPPLPPASSFDFPRGLDGNASPTSAPTRNSFYLTKPSSTSPELYAQRTSYPPIPDPGSSYPPILDANQWPAPRSVPEHPVQDTPHAPPPPASSEPSENGHFQGLAAQKSLPTNFPPPVQSRSASPLLPASKSAILPANSREIYLFDVQQTFFEAKLSKNSHLFAYWGEAIQVNKFRDVIKKLEALAPAGSGFASNTAVDSKTTSTKTKTSRKRKATSPANISNNDDTFDTKDDVMVADGPKPSVKKAKASVMKKETAREIKKQGKKVKPKSKEMFKAAEDDDDDDDENMGKECEQDEQGKVSKEEKGEAPVDDFTFLMTCMVHSTGEFPKPDYEKVAAEIGAKSASACYHRLWNIKRNWGMTSSGAKKVAGGTKSRETTTTPKTPGTSTSASGGGGSTGIKKRGRPKKWLGTEPAITSKKVAVCSPAENAGGGNYCDDDESLVDTPSKMPKMEDIALDVKQELISVDDDTDDSAKENITD